MKKGVSVQLFLAPMLCFLSALSLVPRPHPAFRPLNPNPLLLFRTNSDEKLGWAWERGYSALTQTVSE